MFKQKILSPEELEEWYTLNGGGEYPGYPREVWIEDTNATGSYWDWVYEQLSDEADFEVRDMID